MQLFLNECSIQGQFSNDDEFREAIANLLLARTSSPVFSKMRTSSSLAGRRVSHGRTVRETVSAWKGSPQAQLFLAWVSKYGPFIEEDRTAEEQDLFLCMGVEVTDGGIGEAARRIKALQKAATFSFEGGVPDFAHTPLVVTHGFEDDPVATYEVPNYWQIGTVVEEAAIEEKPAENWREMIDAARRLFPRLHLPDSIMMDRRLAQEPFEASIRDRAYGLLRILNEYMSHRGPNGIEGARCQEILQQYFQGDRAPFSPESATNKRDHKWDMTFTDPDGGSDLFCDWHGKISHRYFRIHFEWPVPSSAERLKVLYIGPKLTKS